ncbi:MAG TPA: NADP transhydrogenase subunit alpha, partial [Microbacteriaceae bacterium]|nr:NADP transhydrogenase subunit alpha [Microbacteriaceae bacterium]
ENTNEAIANILGPKSVHDRYITEDLPFGLVPMSQLALKVGVKTPIMDSIVSLGSAVCGIDFWATGRTLASLGLAEMDAEAIVALVNS